MTHGDKPDWRRQLAVDAPSMRVASWIFVAGLVIFAVAALTQI